MVHQCPRCDLRFPSEAEVVEHLDVDHAASRQAWERYRYPQGPRHAPLYATDVEAPSGAPRRYLVVANQTLPAPELVDHIHELAASTDCSFTVVVPATSAVDYPMGALTFSGPVAGAGERQEGVDAGAAQARWRLRRTIESLRGEGVRVDGTIGSPDPFTAVQQMLRREAFDGVIISTLPVALSRWMRMDLPRRIERALTIPVTTIVTAQRPASTGDE